MHSNDQMTKLETVNFALKSVQAHDQRAIHIDRSAEILQVESAFIGLKITPFRSPNRFLINR